LFLTQAVKAHGNAFFRLRMFLLALDRTATPFGVRVIAVLSLIIWIAVTACGRTMACEL
jgi:hypothetical protein